MGVIEDPRNSTRCGWRAVILLSTPACTADDIIRACTREGKRGRRYSPGPPRRYRLLTQS
jgi:hypothetical protein